MPLRWYFNQQCTTNIFSFLSKFCIQTVFVAALIILFYCYLWQPCFLFKTKTNKHNDHLKGLHFFSAKRQSDKQIHKIKQSLTHTHRHTHQWTHCTLYQNSCHRLIEADRAVKCSFHPTDDRAHPLFRWLDQLSPRAWKMHTYFSW